MTPRAPPAGAPGRPRNDAATRLALWLRPARVAARARRVAAAYARGVEEGRAQEEREAEWGRGAEEDSAAAL